MLSNYKKMKLESVVFMDLETQSTVDLRKMGGTVYANHPDTRIMVGIFLKGKKLTVWVNKSSCPEGLENETINPITGFGLDDYTVTMVVNDALPAYPITNTFVAHNAEQFDSLIWPEKQRKWFDSIGPVRASGLQAGIDALGTLYFNHGKDENGKRAMLMLSKAKEAKGKIIYNKGTVALWIQLIKYAIIDVLIMRHAYIQTQDFIEREVIQTHTIVNNRGIHIDIPLLQHLLTLWDNVEISAHTRINELTKGIINSTNIKSHQAIKKWLESEGLNLEKLNNSVSKTSLENFYHEPENYLEEGSDDDETIAKIVHVLQLRSMANRTSKSKLLRMLLSTDKDSRLRNSIVYYGSHTGRFAGRGVQPLNLPKGVLQLDIEELFRLYESGELDLAKVKEVAMRTAIKYGIECREDDLLTTILRPVFRASPGKKLGIIDYASIEARVLSWLCDETWLVQEFHSPTADPYLIMASDIYGRPITKADKNERQVGKIVELGSGYQMGAAKLKIFCSTAKPSIDLLKAGTTAELCIKSYRRKHPTIVKQWKLYEIAAMEAINGRPVTTGKCRFFSRNGCLHITLPSGRSLTYRGIHIVKEVPIWALAKGMTMAEKDAIKYRGNFGQAKTLYGGLITENITQAVARDILTDQLVWNEKNKVTTVLHCHDEIVFEENDNFEKVAKQMSSSPTWASGLPIAVEGHMNERYVKIPFKTDRTIKAHLGKVIG